MADLSQRGADLSSMDKKLNSNSVKKMQDRWDVVHEEWRT